MFCDLGYWIDFGWILVLFLAQEGTALALLDPDLSSRHEKYLIFSILVGMIPGVIGMVANYHRTFSIRRMIYGRNQKERVKQNWDPATADRDIPPFSFFPFGRTFFFESSRLKAFRWYSFQVFTLPLLILLMGNGLVLMEDSGVTWVRPFPMVGLCLGALSIGLGMTALVARKHPLTTPSASPPRAITISAQRPNLGSRPIQLV